MKTLFTTLVILLTFHLLQAQDIEAVVTNPLCSDGNGSIDITFSGGVSPYTYSWSDGSTSEDLDVLFSGSYSLTITDNQGESYVGDWVIEEPTQITLDLIHQEPTCHPSNGVLDGSLVIIASGGTGDFSYTWSGPGVEEITDSEVSGLGEGFYAVTITDANGCTQFSEFDLVEPEEIIIDENVNNLDCVLGQTQFGSIQIDVVGGFPPYTYDWSGNVLDPTTLEQDNLSSGEYSLTVTDSNGCSAQEEYTVTGADPLDVSVMSTDVSCNNGTPSLSNIDLTISGGVEPYNYNWSGTGVNVTSASQQNLEVGTYFVTVADSEGCQMEEISIEINSEFIAAPSLCLITNDNPDGYNTVYWEDPEDLTGVDQYNIYREGSSVGQFNLIGELEFGPENKFFDTDASSIQQAYRYYVTSANACGIESAPSDIHKTIHLTINQGSFGNMNLIWDEYEGIEYDQIVIYRGDSPSTLEVYETLPGNLFSYTDDEALSGDAYYQIVITTSVDCNTNHALFQLKSNVAGFFVNSVEDIDWLTEVYPNPFKDVVSIAVDISATATIMDMNGNVIVDYKLNPGTNTLSTTDIPNGMYIVRIVSNGESAIWRGLKSN